MHSTPTQHQDFTVRSVTSFHPSRIALTIAGVAFAITLAPGRAHATDAVIEWNEIALETATPLADPAEILRTIAIVQIGVFDAVNSITANYKPYLEKIPAPPGASPEAAAIAAAHRALVVLHPETAAVVDPLRESALAAIPDATARARAWPSESRPPTRFSPYGPTMASTSSCPTRRKPGRVTGSPRRRTSSAHFVPGSAAWRHSPSRAVGAIAPSRRRPCTPANTFATSTR